MIASERATVTGELERDEMWLIKKLKALLLSKGKNLVLINHD